MKTAKTSAKSLKKQAIQRKISSPHMPASSPSLTGKAKADLSLNRKVPSPSSSLRRAKKVHLTTNARVPYAPSLLSAIDHGPTRLHVPTASSKGAKSRVSSNPLLPPEQEEKAKCEQIASLSMPSRLLDVVAAIRELHRERQDYHSAEKRLTLQIKSIQRRVHAAGCPLTAEAKAAGKLQGHAKCSGVYDALPAAALVLAEQRDLISTHRKRPEKEMQKLAKSLPVWSWVEYTRGLGALGLAQIIAECGDLSNYNNPAKLWKRMGLGMYQRADGLWERQQKAAGENGVLSGYSPTRRSILFVIGDSIIKAGGEYRELYDSRKLLEAQKPACGRFKCTGEHCTPGHIHNRAKRYMEKRLLRNLWRAWRSLDKAVLQFP